MLPYLTRRISPEIQFLSPEEYRIQNLGLVGFTSEKNLASRGIHKHFFNACPYKIKLKLRPVLAAGISAKTTDAPICLSPEENEMLLYCILLLSDMYVYTISAVIEKAH
jgi:hypothetical protein